MIPFISNIQNRERKQISGWQGVRGGGGDEIESNCLIDTGTVKMF